MTTGTDERDALRLYTRTHTVRASDAAADEDLAWFRTGAPHEELNGVLHCSRRRLDDALAAMDGVPALWHSWPGRPESDIESALRDRGFAFVEEEPVMTMELATARPAQAAHDARIRVVADDASLAAWAGVWTGGAVDDAVVAALAWPGLGGAAPVRYLLAEEDGAAIGCAAAVVVDDVVAVEHIVTAASHRRKGIGTGLTVAAIDAGRRAGATTAVLTASPDGEAIYRRLGFETRETVRRFGRGA